jgi:hypothetical protein
MSNPRAVTIEYHVVQFPGEWLWIRKVRDNGTYRLLVESRLITRKSGNPFTEETER